jgi:hypothetical protein
MKNAFGALSVVLAFVFGTCSPWDKSDVKIERFEYMDIPRSTPVADDSIASEAYLIHGYDSRHEEEIHEITDQYVCDSIIPNRTFTRFKYLTFFKKSKNTNQENFQIRRSERRMVHAKTNDKLFHYLLAVKDSAIFSITKQNKMHPFEPQPSPQKIHCD